MTTPRPIWTESVLIRRCSGADVVDELLQALNLAGIQSDDELDAAFGTVPDLHDEYDDDDEAAVDEADEAAR
jgi:hypothetical protein